MSQATLAGPRTDKAPARFHGTTDRTPLSFWLLAAVLLAYVALCTGNRDNIWQSDAWEHHRAILALVQDLHHPGNPVFATDQPSIRYGPYSVGLALVARATHADPYWLLSVMAVVNTMLLVLALWAVLRVFHEARIATVALFILFSLYGGDPGYPNTFALADLPWHQVNPSALAFPITVLAAVLLKWMSEGKGRWWGWLLLAPMMAEALLDHGMTGTFGFLLLFSIAATRPAPVRWRMLAGTCVLGVAVVGLCALWPWYDFLLAVRSQGNISTQGATAVAERWYEAIPMLRRHPRPDYWFNYAVTKMMVLEWTAPAVALSVCALGWWRRPLVRDLLFAGAVTWAAGLLGCMVRSATLVRFFMPGTFLLDLPVAVFVYESGLFKPRTWAARLRGLFEAQPAQSVVGVLAMGLILYCLIPQLWDVVYEPYLARPFLAGLAHRDDRQLNLKPLYDRLLDGIGARDVVLSDLITSWPVPSTRGRIVAALHREFFVPGQDQREADVQAFFGRVSNQERIEILDRYHVRWIILNQGKADDSDKATNPGKLSQWAYRDLLEESAVVKRDGPLVLLDAEAWRKARQPHPMGASRLPPVGRTPAPRTPNGPAAWAVGRGWPSLDAHQIIHWRCPWPGLLGKAFSAYAAHAGRNASLSSPSCLNGAI